jgi:chromate transport protein ChrA
LSDTTTPAAATADAREGFLGILLVFLRLAVTSFGGPIAHIGYLREEFVTRRRWIGEAAYADLVALAQFMPGPASSQVGFSIGVLRGGLPGGAAAWLGFTMPSALVMLLAAYGVDLAAGGTGAGIVHGLKLVAVAVVAQAVWGMAGNLCPDRTRATIAVAASLALLLLPSALTQIAVILAGAAAGVALCRNGAVPSEATLGFRVSPASGIAALVLFAVLLLALPLLAGASHALALAEASYRAGALVFGGGHVVLPLLERAFVPPNTRARRGCLPRRLWRGAGGAGAAVHLRGLPRGGAGAGAERRGRGGDRPGRGVPAGAAADLRHAALLGRLPPPPRCAGDAARGKCGGGRHPAGGAVRPDLDLDGAGTGGFRHRAGGLRGAGAVEGPSLGGGGADRGGWCGGCRGLTAAGRPPRGLACWRKPCMTRGPAALSPAATPRESPPC